jgi:TATA-box binding protein (TBP) (component of TFIID and TFIIIB)
MGVDDPEKYESEYDDIPQETSSKKNAKRSLDSESGSGLFGFKRAPKKAKLNIDVIESKKSTTMIENFASGTERIRIENHVYTTNIGRPINLRKLNEKTLTSHGPQYNQKKFAALVMRWRDPRIALLMFACGKFVCSGAKNRYQAKMVFKDAINIVHDLGYTDVNKNNIDGKLQNMVCSVKLTFGINLSELANDRVDICEYRKEIFPGAYLRIPKLGSINIGVYEGGKMIITGIKEIREIKLAINTVLPILSKYQRKITMDPIAILNSKSKHEGTLSDNTYINYQVQRTKKRATHDIVEEPVAKKQKEVAVKNFITVEDKGNTSIKGIGIEALKEFASSVKDIDTVPDSIRSMLPI